MGTGRSAEIIEIIGKAALVGVGCAGGGVGMAT